MSLFRNTKGRLIRGAIPNAPSGLTATADYGYTRIKLTWVDNSDNEANFEVEQSADAGATWTALATVSKGVNYNTDTGLTRSSTYYYRVRATNTSGKSGYTTSANATVFQLSDITLFADYDANADVYENAAGDDPCEDGDGVWVMKDQANSYDLVQATAAARPSYQTNELNGLPVIRGAAGDVLKASTAADWKFLHDGTEFGVYIVWKSTSTNPGVYYVLYDTTNTTASANVGMATYFNDVTTTDAMVSIIAKGASGDFEGQPTTPPESIRPGEWHISAVRLKDGDLESWNDGFYGGYEADTVDGAPSAANPASSLAVGALGNNTLNLVGDWARMLIVSGTVTDTQHRQLQSYLAEEYDLFNLSFFEAESVVQHDASDPDHNGFVGLGLADNGDLIVAYGKADDHAGVSDLIIRISEDRGETWGAETTLWDYSVDGGGTTGWGGPKFTTLSNGDIFMTVGGRVSGAGIVDGVGYFKSTDNGASWAGPTQITSPAFTDLAAEGGGILELANGDLLYPYYGQDTGDANEWSIGVSRSQDSGDTWAHLAVIADGPIDGTAYAEPGLVQVSSGNVICLIRENGLLTVETVRKCTSDDNGATWGAVSYLVTGDGMQAPLMLSTGEIINPIRGYISTNDERSAIMFSADDGASWQTGYRFVDQQAGGRMTYGQFVELPDGTICHAYGDENTGQSVSDVMFVKTS